MRICRCVYFILIVLKTFKATRTFKVTRAILHLPHYLQEAAETQNQYRSTLVQYLRLMTLLKIKCLNAIKRLNEAEVFFVYTE